MSCSQKLGSYCCSKNKTCQHFKHHLPPAAVRGSFWLTGPWRNINTPNHETPELKKVLCAPRAPVPGQKLFQISFKTKQRACFGSRPDGSTAANSRHLLCPPTPVRFQHHASNVTIFGDCQALQFKKYHQGRRMVFDPDKCSGSQLKVKRWHLWSGAVYLVNNTHQHSQTIVTSDYSGLHSWLPNPTKKRIAAKKLRFRGRCHFFLFQSIDEIRAMMHDTRSRRPGELWPDRDWQFQSLRPKLINSNSHNINDVRVYKPKAH